MTSIVESRLPALAAICRRYGVMRLEVFGSAADGTFDPERSDVDFLVEFRPGADLGPWMGRFFDLKRELEETMGRPVDLVMASGLRNPYFRREVEKTRRPVYAA